MASYRNENRPDSGDLLSWIITIVLLVSPVWPIGLILLLRKLTGGSRRRASRHPYDIQREGGPVPGTQGMPGAQRQTPPVGRQHVGRSPRQGRPVNLDRGKGLTVWGIVLTVIFGIALTGFPAVAMSGGFLSALAVMSPVIGFFGGGLAMIWAGTQRTKKAKRYRTLKELYRPFLTADTLLFGDPAELAAWATPDVLLADPLFFPSLRPWFPRAELLACPEPGVCGRGGLPARWLEDVACVMSAIGKSHTW